MRGIGLLVVFAAALAGCGEAPKLYIDNAWVRLAATPGTPAAGYFTMHGGPVEARLMDVSSPVVIRTELHETMTGGGGMASMKPIEGGVAVPANGKVVFGPGGKHLMLFSVNPGIVPPRKLPMILTFANGERIAVDAVVYRAGDPLPK